MNYLWHLLFHKVNSKEWVEWELKNEERRLKKIKIKLAYQETVISYLKWCLSTFKN